MARLDDLTPGARVTGVVAGQAVTVVQVQWDGTAALTLTHRDDAQGRGLPRRRVRGGPGRVSSRPEPGARSAHCRGAQTRVGRKGGGDSRWQMT